MNLNAVVIVGRLVRNPDLKYTPAGDAVVQMRVAVDRAGDKQDDGKYASGFFDVTAFGHTAEAVAAYLVKGSQAGFSGSLRFHEWEAKDGGGKRSKVEIAARDVQFLAQPKGYEKPEATTAESSGDFADFPDNPVGEVAEDDGIPF